MRKPITHEAVKNTTAVVMETVIPTRPSQVSVFFTSQTNLFRTHYLPRRDLTTIIRSRLSQQKASNAVSEDFNAVAREKGLYEIIIL